MDSLEFEPEPSKPVTAEDGDSSFTLLVLDRDGTVIEHVPYLCEPNHVRLLPTAARTIAEANSLAIPVVVVTNQSVVSQGMCSLGDVDRVNERMLALLRSSGAHINAIYVCPHGDGDGCSCRKPKPGLLLRALREHGSTASEMLVVGDNVTDGYAADAAGARFVGVLTGVQQEEDADGTQWRWEESLEQAVFHRQPGKCG